ncbi:putative two-component system response regulator [Tropheryma whipplei TW08/27]|nr:putative two-component system response regulator [Tropheryma whipplei TW08/27]
MMRNESFPLQTADLSPCAVVAEDESIIRMDINDIMSDAGYKVVAEAGDGETAVALTLEHNPDIVVMDIKMPFMDGITAAEKISSRSAVVLLTAFNQQELVERAVDAGVMAYVSKPFSRGNLIPAVAVALERFRKINSLQKQLDDASTHLEIRKLTDHAKGLLCKHMGLSEPEAFRWIQKMSMNRRISMKEVSKSIIAQLAGK